MSTEFWKPVEKTNDGREFKLHTDFEIPSGSDLKLSVGDNEILFTEHVPEEASYKVHVEVCLQPFDGKNPIKINSYGRLKRG